MNPFEKLNNNNNNYYYYSYYIDCHRSCGVLVKKSIITVGISATFLSMRYGCGRKTAFKLFNVPR